MVIIKINETVHQFPSDFSEITVGQLDTITSIFESDEPEITQWVRIVSFLSGFSTDEIEEWPYDDFLTMISQMFIKFPEVEKISEFEFDGITYTDTNKTSLTIRQTAALEKIFSGPNKNRLSMVLGVIFTNPNLSKAENLNEGEIESRAKIFAQQPLKQFLPQLLSYGLEFMNRIKSTMSDEITPIGGDNPA